MKIIENCRMSGFYIYVYDSATERCRCSGLYFSSNHKVKGYLMGTNRQLLSYYMPVFFDFLEQT
jgi:hypothetical protein